MSCLQLEVTSIQCCIKGKSSENIICPAHFLFLSVCAQYLRFYSWKKDSESIEKLYQLVLGHSLSIRITVQLFSHSHVISRRLLSAVQQLFSHILDNTISFWLLSSPLSPSIFLSLSVPTSLILYITLFLFLVGYHGCEEGSYQERRLYRSWC